MCVCAHFGLHNTGIGTVTWSSCEEEKGYILELKCGHGLRGSAK